jgi:cytochrome c-type biogenesis protein
MRDDASSIDLPGSAGSRWRLPLATVGTVVVLTVAVGAGVAASPDGGAPVIFVNRISSEISAAATHAGGAIWWTYAFILGAIAAFNPCGFALLPAYLGLYLGDELGRPAVWSRVRRSLRVATVVAVSFTALFGTMGAVFTLASSAIVSVLPWAGLVVGVVLVLIGGLTLAGTSVGQSLPHRLADRLGRRAGERGTRGYAAFGLAYGVASLGCTLPLFMALMGTAIAVGGRLAAVIAFALYGAGMAAVFGVVTIVTGIATIGAVRRARTLTRFVSALSAVLLLLSGAYVVYYWLSAGRLLLA